MLGLGRGVPLRARTTPKTPAFASGRNRTPKLARHRQPLHRVPLDSFPWAQKPRALGTSAARESLPSSEARGCRERLARARMNNDVIVDSPKGQGRAALDTAETNRERPKYGGLLLFQLGSRCPTLIKRAFLPFLGSGDESLLKRLL